jgi:hypothetical protein
VTGPTSRELYPVIVVIGWVSVLGLESKPVNVIDPVTDNDPEISAEPVKFRKLPDGPTGP